MYDWHTKLTPQPSYWLPVLNAYCMRMCVCLFMCVHMCAWVCVCSARICVICHVRVRVTLFHLKGDQRSINIFVIVGLMSHTYLHYPSHHYTSNTFSRDASELCKQILSILELLFIQFRLYDGSYYKYLPSLPFCLFHIVYMHLFYTNSNTHTYYLTSPTLSLFLFSSISLWSAAHSSAGRR